MDIGFHGAQQFAFAPKSKESYQIVFPAIRG